MPKFNNLEARLVRLSAARYQRPFYRWGHLTGWLVLPVACLLFVPSLKPYQAWFPAVVFILGIEWYHVVTTRVIGKLNAQLQANTPATPK